MREKTRLTTAINPYGDFIVRMDVFQDEEGAPYTIFQVYGFGKCLLYHDSRLDDIAPLSKIIWTDVIARIPQPASDEDFYVQAQKALEELDIPLLEAVSCSFPELRRCPVYLLNLDWLTEDFHVKGMQSITAVKSLAEDLYYEVVDDIEIRLLYKDLLDSEVFIFNDPDSFAISPDEE